MPSVEKMRASVTPASTNGTGMPSGSTSRSTPASVSNSDRSASAGPGWYSTTLTSASGPSSARTSARSSSGFPPGHEAPVQPELHLGGDHVDRVAAAHARSRSPCRAAGGRRTALVTDRPEHCVRDRRHGEKPQRGGQGEGEGARHGDETGPYGGRDAHRQSLPIEPSQRLAELRGGAAAQGHRPVPPGPRTVTSSGHACFSATAIGYSRTPPVGIEMPPNSPMAWRTPANRSG